MSSQTFSLSLKFYFTNTQKLGMILNIWNCKIRFVELHFPLYWIYDPEKVKLLTCKSEKNETISLEFIQN